MSISLPTISLPPLPKALFDMIRLEAGPGSLPATPLAAGVTLAIYAAGETADQYVHHPLLPSLVYGPVCAILLALTAIAVLSFVGTRDKFWQIVTALAAIGAIVALVSVALSSFVSLVFPPPLPTAKLVGFVLFPLVVWKGTLFIWIFRHGGLRFIPALAVAIVYVGLTGFVLAPMFLRIYERLILTM
jgi:hypothetical protein